MASGDESSLYSRINYAEALTGNFCGSVREQLKRCTQGLARTRIALCQRPGADTEETGRYDLAWKDLCSVLTFSANSNELSKV